MRTAIVLALVLSVSSIVATAEGFAQPPRPPAPPTGTVMHRDIAYVPSGHERQKLDLYLQKENRNRPLIIMVHGGAFMFGDKSGENVAKFLKAGYAVASLNYRLSGDAVFPAQIEDCKAAVRWLRAHANEFGYDSNRFGAYGESAGGNLVALLGTTGDTKVFDVGGNLNVSSKVQAVVDYFGPTDFLQMDSHLAPGGDTHNDADSPESKLIGSPIQENKEKTAKANPIAYISKNTPPFFLAHGDSDRQVPHHQSELLELALKKAGVPVTLYTLKGVGHAFHDETTDKMALAFFVHYLSPATRR